MKPYSVILKMLGLVLASFIAFNSPAFGQHAEMKYKQKLIGCSWDSTYLQVTQAQSLNLSIENTTDTLAYFFTSGSKADSATKVVYKIFGADVKTWYVVRPGVAFKNLFMRHLRADSTAVYLERRPPEE